MTLTESFKENWYMLILPAAFITILGGTYLITSNEHTELQKIVDKENAELDQVKGDCKALGQWILKQGANPLNLDPVLDNAQQLYMVNCTHGSSSP